MSRTSSAISNRSGKSERPISSQNKNKYQVLIIGAGMAGLSAAVKLIESGVKNIAILEADNRIGGRIHTQQFQNGFIEIGAQWIHGTEGNPIYALSESIGNIDQSSEKSSSMFYASQDGQILDEDIVEQIINEIHEATEKFDDKVGDDLLISLGGLFEATQEKLIENYGSQVDPELIKAIVISETSNERYESACDNLENLSAAAWCTHEAFEGDLFTKQNQGYVKVIEYLESKLPKGTVRLNESVEQINWSDTNSIKVKTHRGSIYETTRLICTVSLGYLKANHSNMFNPNLPDEKIKAINNLGFGCVNKFWLVFEEPLTSYDFSGLQIFYRNDVNLVLDSVKKWNLKDNQFFKEITEMEILPNHDNVLIGFIAGASGVYMESLEEECLLDIFNEILTKCFPKLNLPRPKSIVISKWHSNPFAKGSYTYVPTGQPPSLLDLLSKPVLNCLFFAGEATTSLYTGTVHGAYITGQNTADLVVESLDI